MSSYFHSASQSCPILSANCRYNLRLFRLFRGDSSGMDKSSSAKCLLYSDACERGAKSHVAKKIPGRGLRRSRDEKGNQGVRDFRFSNILQLFSIYFFQLLYVIIFFSTVEPLLTDTSLIRTVHLVPGKCPYILCKNNL